MSENFLRLFSEEGKKIILNAVKEARKLNHFYIGVEHVFLGMIKLKDSIINNVLEKLGVNTAEVERKIREYIGMDPRLASDKMFLTPRMTKIIKLSLSEANKRGMKTIDEIDLIMAMILEGESVPIRILKSMNLNLNEIKTMAINAMAERRGIKGDPRTPLLNMYGRDLTQLAREGKIEPVIGREKELERIMRILMKRKKNNPLLVGEAGVGKTAIVEGFAYKIAHKEVPDRLADKRVIELLMSSIVSGTVYRGQFEERLKGILDEIKSNKNIVIFIDEIHTIVGAGRAEGVVMDASNMMKPMLAKGELRCIGATTYKEYSRYIKKDPALDRRFQLVKISEPTLDQTIEILKKIRRTYEEHHGVIITDAAIKAAVELSIRYITDRKLPDKAIDLIDEACSREILGPLPESSHGMFQEEMPKKPKVDREDIAVIVSEWTGISVGELMEEEKQRLLKMEEFIKKRIVDQDHCIKEVCEKIRMAKSGLAAENKPLAIFLFLGPTGVGKTELAKALAEFLFHDEKRMITLDMSEYKERGSIYNIIGAPMGYVGYEEGGRLTNMVRRRPYSIILLDEIEKAHPEVIDLFLQVFDEGRLTDREGRICDFTNTIIIMTSNLGMDLKQYQQMGFKVSGRADARAWEEALEEFFRPEFMNRIDKILVFNPLSRNDLRQIAHLMLNKQKKRLMQKYQVTLKVTDEAIEFLVENCDLNYGARPLRRAIEDYILEPLSEKLLAEEIQKGDTAVVFKENRTLKLDIKRKKEV